MTDDHLSALPLLTSIALTGTVLATAIAWQATGVPIVALLLVPWLLVMIALVLPRRSTVGHKVRIPPTSRRRTMAAGMAVAAIAAALTTGGDWSDAGEPEPISTPNPAVAASSSASAAPTCEAMARVPTGFRDR